MFPCAYMCQSPSTHVQYIYNPQRNRVVDAVRDLSQKSTIPTQTSFCPEALTDVKCADPNIGTCVASVLGYPGVPGHKGGSATWYNTRATGLIIAQSEDYVLVLTCAHWGLRTGTALLNNTRVVADAKNTALVSFLKSLGEDDRDNYAVHAFIQAESRFSDHTANRCAFCISEELRNTLELPATEDSTRWKSVSWHIPEKTRRMFNVSGETKLAHFMCKHSLLFLTLFTHAVIFACFYPIPHVFSPDFIFSCIISFNSGQWT